MANQLLNFKTGAVEFGGIRLSEKEPEAIFTFNDGENTRSHSENNIRAMLDKINRRLRQPADNDRQYILELRNRRAVMLDPREIAAAKDEHFLDVKIVLLRGLRGIDENRKPARTALVA